MIGIIIWLILIFIIASLSSADFIITLLCMIGGFGVFVLVDWIRFEIWKKKDKDGIFSGTEPEIDEKARERAMTEWENKWKRRHPSRKTDDN